MDATGKIFQISKFPNTLSFVTISGMFRRNFTKIGEIYIPYKFIWSDCIPPKIKQDILAHKGSQTTRATPGDYLASWNRKRMGEHAGPSGVNDDEPRFPAAGTRSLLQTRFFCVCVFCFVFSSQSLSRALVKTTHQWTVLSSAFDFSIGKIFSNAKNSSCELYKVRDVNKIWK